MVNRTLKVFGPKAASAAPLIVAMVMVVMGVSSAAATAATAGPGWTVNVVAQPTNFSPGRNAECAKAVKNGGHELTGINGRLCDRFMVTVRNEGTLAIEGSPVVIKDLLPKNITAVSIAPGEFEGGSESKLECNLTTVSCVTGEALAPGGALVMVVDVEISPEASGGETNTAMVSGGGAPAVSTTTQITVSTTQPLFGVSGFSIEAFGVDGAPDWQAGDHPNAVTTSLQFSTIKFPEGEVGPEGETRPSYPPVQDIKDIVVTLPPGLVGDPQATPRCPEYLLVGNCPKASQVGVMGLAGEGPESPGNEPIPIFNLVPEHGYPAEFGFEYLSREFAMYASVVHTASGYGLRVTVPGLPNWRHVLAVPGFVLTFFGDPAMRDGGQSPRAAFFTTPVDCSAGGLSARVEADSWVNPGVFVSGEVITYPQVTGCDMLQFQPAIAVQPETPQADEPAGYSIDLNLPQTANVFPAVATPELRNAVVTLPEGVSISPSSADGLVGCGETGPEGIDLPTGGHHANEAGEGETIGADGLSHLTAGHCPAGSTLGTVEITTPLLPDPLHGHLYLAQPMCGGEGQPACTEASATNGELYGLYLEAEGSGVVIKLKGSVAANPSTGQLTTTFKENPQLPFSELKIRLTGGARAPLANPQSCGTFTTASDLTPWSAPVTPDATPSSSFPITGCTSPMPFVPSFSAGTVAANAAAFSPLTLTFSRHDGEQALSGLSVTTPPGLLGMLRAVERCPEPQASQGACGEGSLIGHTQVAAGPGSHPFYAGGRVFLTGSYKGAPFGLSIVTAAKAGPFNLGKVIVRAAISVDSHTAQITVTSDPFPQILDGIPLRIQTVNVTIDRPAFIFNPTNCDQQRVTGTIASAQGTNAGVSSPFAVTGCAGLPFHPVFTVSTQAKTSKQNGASLDVKTTYPAGLQANIRSVAVVLPKQLPSRLTTIQQACPEALFNANPAGCPTGSDIGVASARTPVLSSPVVGPIYLVSHGGAAFPDLVLILQGEGITVDLVGSIDIRHGVTSSTFASVPDVPISSFDLTLPEGPHSALTVNLPAKAKGSLCGQSLVMPMRITGQNGALLEQSRRIKVTGCPKAKKHRARHGRRAKKGSRKKGK